jgi:hypothetical protein
VLTLAWQSVLLQKARVFKAFRLRIATPLFAFGKNADIGHWFTMTETNFVCSLTARRQKPAGSSCCGQGLQFPAAFV